MKMPRKKADEQPVTQPVSDDPFDQVSKTLRDITEAVTKVYMGLTQRDAIETLICGMLTRGTVLLYGSHGNYKTSMSKFFGNLFTKPVYKIDFSVVGTDQLKTRLHTLAADLGVDETSLARNLLSGIDVQYSQYGGKIDVSVEINALQYTLKNETPVRVPLNNYVRQVNSFSEQEDVVGYGIDNPLLLKDVPPHMVKRSYMANADFIVLDEVFKNPRLISVLHNILNDKEYDSIVGTGKVEPEAFVLLTNPLNDNYQTNVAMVDFASLDRYMFSAYVSSPTSQEILFMQEQFRQVKPSQLPIETIYMARELYHQVKIPSAIQVLVMGLLSAMSRCYYTVEGKRHVDGKDVFAVEHSCDLCQYGGAAGDKNWSICSKANVGKVRASIAIMNALKAHAFVAGRREANQDDLFFALRHSLPHRIKWSPDFKEDTIASTDKIIARYIELVNNFADALHQVETIIKDPTPATFTAFRKDNRDVPAVLAFVDEFTDRFKETLIAKGDKSLAEALDPSVNLTDALKIFGLDNKKAAKDAAPKP
jgi:MoxR-like ATPase